LVLRSRLRYAITMAPVRRSRKTKRSPGSRTTILRKAAMSASARREELKAFLRARRASVTPEATGLPRGKRRLTPGLRREELAALAGVGVTWYTWLEQGREINVSADTLRRIARALGLSISDERYLFSLAGLPVPGSASFRAPAPPIVQLLLDGF